MSNAIDLAKAIPFKTLPHLSFCHYIQREPLSKGEVYIDTNILISVQKGTKRLHLPNQCLEVGHNKLLFLRRGHYAMSEILNEHYEALLFMYEDDLLLQFIEKYDLVPKLPSHCEISIFELLSTPEIQALIHSVCHYFTGDFAAKEEIIKLKLEEAFLHLLAGDSQAQFLSLLSSVYHHYAFRLLVHKHFSYEDNISHLAEKLHITPQAFRKKFKQTFHMTPKKWQRAKRLEKAEILLRTTDKNISEVCRESGFDNLSWFTQTFKQTYGMTPSELKNNNI